MSAYCYGITARGYQHCWHFVQMHMGNPPQRVEVCCHCSVERKSPAVVEVTTPTHGPHVPKNGR